LELLAPASRPEVDLLCEPDYAGFEYADLDLDLDTADAEAAHPAAEEELLPVTGPDFGWRTDFHAHYRVGHQIGKGSFGTVQLAIHKNSGLETAVKILPKQHGQWTREKTIGRIMREVQVLKQMQAVNGVVRLLDFFEEEDCVRVVTDICWGGDLQAFALQEGCLDEPALARVAYEVLRVIEGFHDAGYIHGDVKPGNFVCTVPCRDIGRDLPPGGLKAIDLGCTQAIGNLRLTKRTGTPVFMAPEVFGHNFAYKADIWAIGVMLYWLYDGVYPCIEEIEDLQSACLGDLAEAITTCDARFDSPEWQNMSAEGRDFVRACLNRDEDKRLDVKSALAHPWINKLGAVDEDVRPGVTSLDDDYFQ